MKKAKKLTAFLLLAAFVFAFIVPVTAMADNVINVPSEGKIGKITIDNPEKGKKYTAYKIFDVVYNYEDGNKENGKYVYTVAKDSPWFSIVQAYAGNASNGLTLKQMEDNNKYNVIVDENTFSAPSFAAALRTAVKSNSINDSGKQEITASDTAVIFSNLSLGYYFVYTNSGALCNLTTTNNEVTIHDKNDIPFDKVDDKDSVEIGETVTYTITGKVPDTTGFTSYTYKITDTMSKGLTFNKNVTVKIGQTDITDKCTLTNTPNDNNATGFELTIPVMDYQAQIGETITVTYTATVNEKAVATIEKNYATLEYSNDPTDSTKTEKRIDEEKVYSAKIVIDKYAADNKSQKLSGAKFKLYKEESGAKTYYKYTATGVAKVEWVDDKADATPQTTNDNGAANFIGLKNGTYYLEEIEAPDGYNLLKEPVEITISGSDTVVDNLTVTAEVANNTGTLLPSTGGMGTTIFYVLGAVLVVGAGVLLVTKKRMSNQR